MILHLKASDRVSTPWRNGGGMTRVVMVHPQDAGMDDFDWRVSIADVASDGEFSRFQGVDRWMGVVSGAGIRLECEGLDPAVVTSNDRPFFFSGDVRTKGVLLDGAITDVNLMVRRGGSEARLSRFPITGECSVAVPGAGLMIFQRGAGQLTIGTETVKIAPLDAVYCPCPMEWHLLAPMGDIAWLVEFASKEEDTR
jgi:environmental stress-induced protein Ves